jgi:hypothetical protein
MPLWRNAGAKEFGAQAACLLFVGFIDNIYSNLQHVTGDIVSDYLFSV